MLDPFRLSDEEKASIMKSSQGMHQSVAASSMRFAPEAKAKPQLRGHFYEFAF